MRSLVIGADGLLGRSIVRTLEKEGHTTITAGRHFDEQEMFLDLEHFKSGNWYDGLRIYQPHNIFVCAYHTSVDECETNPKTWEPNVSAMLRLTQLADDLGIKIIFPSSSYVFDGQSHKPYSEEFPTNPINVYGMQKRAVEYRLRNTRHLVARTVGLFGADDPRKINFAYQVYRGLIPFVPSQQFMNPIHVDDFSRILVSLVEEGENGIINIAGDTVLSKFDFAVQIVEAFDGHGVVLDFPKELESIKQVASRPRMGALGMDKLKYMGYFIPPLELGIMQFVEDVILQGEDERLHLSG